MNWRRFFSSWVYFVWFERLTLIIPSWKLPANTIFLLNKKFKNTLVDTMFKDLSLNINLILWLLFSYLSSLLSQIYFTNIFEISDLDECFSSPCVHGVCTNQLYSYTCDCQPGYTGTNCETGKMNIVHYYSTTTPYKIPKIKYLILNNSVILFF